MEKWVIIEVIKSFRVYFCLKKTLFCIFVHTSEQLFSMSNFLENLDFLQKSFTTLTDHWPVSSFSICGSERDSNLLLLLELPVCRTPSKLFLLRSFSFIKSEKVFSCLSWLLRTYNSQKSIFRSFTTRQRF